MKTEQKINAEAKHLVTLLRSKLKERKTCQQETLAELDEEIDRLKCWIQALRWVAKN